jgi:subtilisin family serine protease
MDVKRAAGPRHGAAWPQRVLGRGVPLALLAGAGLVAFGGPAPASAAAPSPSALLAQALANAKNGGWVHEVTQAKEQGHTFSAVNDIGQIEGRQNIKNDATRAKVMLIGGVGYIEANAVGVASYFQLTTKNPGKLAGKWFIVTSSDADFSTVTAAVTLASDFNGLQMSGPYQEGKRTVVNHQKVIPIHGFISGSTNGPKAAVTLDVTATGTTLPVRFTAKTKTVKETTVWSRWGHVVKLTIPPHPRPIPTQ